MSLLDPPPAPTETTPPPAAAGTTPPPATPAAAAAAAATTIPNELPPNWFLQFGDQFAQHAPTLERFKTVEDLAKSFLHFRTQGPAYPGADATPDAVEKFRALAQVPADPTGYALAKPDNLPEGLEWNADAMAKIAQIAHANHVPAPAMQALVAAQMEMETARIQSQAQAEATRIQEARAEMQKVLGTDPHEFQRNAGSINHMITTLADKAGIAPDSPGLAAIGTNPDALKLIYQVVKMTSEDPVRRPAGYSDLRTKAQRGHDIMSGKDPDWSSRYQSGDPEAIKLVQQLLDAK